MQNLWNDAEAKEFSANALSLRVYTSRLLGRDPSLVLHGGGNTSVKIKEKNLFGEPEELLYVKGSGWDLVTITEKGFAPVKLQTLLKMARLEKLTDSEMVKHQKAAMTDPGAPAPSVEAILHAIIPYEYVDHTHTDTVLAVMNAPDGEKALKEIYGNKVLLVPYVMPGFILARKVFEMIQDMDKDSDWEKLEGIILLNHGVFSFGKTAKQSYDRMIDLVGRAEQYLNKKNALKVSTSNRNPKIDSLRVAKLRRLISKTAKSALVMKTIVTPEAVGFSENPKAAKIATQGPLTPDHVLHTKQLPLVLSADDASSDESQLQKYAKTYEEYFKRNALAGQTCLDPAPRWVLWPNHGVLALGINAKRAQVVADINRHSLKTFQWAENLGGWNALPEKDIFDVEYWELEQAKLKKSGSNPQFQGKVALITGAASGIGLAAARALQKEGAAVVGLDLNPEIKTLLKGSDALGIECDVTNPEAVKSAVEKAVLEFGGIDILVTNAGSFPKSSKLSDTDPKVWDQVMKLNLNSHFYVIKECAPYLELGLDASVIVVASKNVPAPGPGAGAYSSAKAGLTQLARVTALELGPKGVRVNILHPHGVFDTGIWTKDVLNARAASYGISVEEYKTNNILKVEITTKDIAELICAMAGTAFSKVTGAQIPVDGGSDRVI